MSGRGEGGGEALELREEGEKEKTGGKLFYSRKWLHTVQVKHEIGERKVTRRNQPRLTPSPNPPSTPSTVASTAVQ